jgi:uncharacterized protein YbjT (DUF2867 family)
MTSPILVTGGTGTLGRHVVPLLRASGHDVRILTRHARPATDGIAYVTGDLLKGVGVEAAVDGVKTVLHLAGGPKGDDEATRTLVRAASRAGVRHLLSISVIGADRIPLAWMRTKLESERAVAGSGIPWTTLRAAQFRADVGGVPAREAGLGPSARCAGRVLLRKGPHRARPGADHQGRVADPLHVPVRHRLVQ